MILIANVQLAEITAPTPDPDYKIWVFFGMFLRVNQCVAVNRVYLYLMPAEVYERFYKRSGLFSPSGLRKTVS